MQEYEQTLDGMLLMPMLRPIRLDGTGPNAIIFFFYKRLRKKQFEILLNFIADFRKYAI